MTQVIEQNMTALDGLIYMSSSSTSDGSVGITLTFVSDTNPDIAQVQVQNRLQAVVPLLPQIVQQQGITVNKIINSNLMAIGFYSEDGSLTADRHVRLRADQGRQPDVAGRGRGQRSAISAPATRCASGSIRTSCAPTR